MRRLCWISLCFVLATALLTACSTESEDVPDTSSANITMTWNGLPLFEYLESESLDMLKAAFTANELMDMGGLLTEEQMASLSAEKQELLTPSATHVSLRERYEAEADLYADYGTDVFMIDDDVVSVLEYTNYLIDNGSVEDVLTNENLMSNLKTRLTVGEVDTLPASIQMALK